MMVTASHGYSIAICNLSCQLPKSMGKTVGTCSHRFFNCPPMALSTCLQHPITYEPVHSAMYCSTCVQHPNTCSSYLQLLPTSLLAWDSCLFPCQWHMRSCLMINVIQQQPGLPGFPSLSNVIR